MELVGSDTVDGGNGAAEDVISALIGLGRFEGVDIERFLDDEDGGFVARGVRVKRGEIFACVD